MAYLSDAACSKDRRTMRLLRSRTTRFRAQERGVAKQMGCDLLRIAAAFDEVRTGGRPYAAATNSTSVLVANGFSYVGEATDDEVGTVRAWSKCAHTARLEQAPPRLALLRRFPCSRAGFSLVGSGSMLGETLLRTSINCRLASDSACKLIALGSRAAAPVERAPFGNRYLSPTIGGLK